MARNFLGIAICSLLLSGCSWVDEWSPWSSSQLDIQPPSSNIRVVQKGDSEALVVPKGTERGNVRRVSSLVDPLARIERLETALNDIRNSMEKMMPAITRLANIEVELQRMIAGGSPAALANISPAAGQDSRGDFRKVSRQALIEEYRRESATNGHNKGTAGNQYAASVPQSVTPTAPQPVVSAAETYEATANRDRQQFDSHVQRFRVGTYPDKTRFVLDTSGQPDFVYALRDNGRLLMVDLPGTGWDTERFFTETVPSSLIASYTVQKIGKDGAGTRLLVKLKEPARVLWAETLPPAGDGQQDHRVVFDLAKI